MSFKNPSLFSSVSREEFENLKAEVKNINNLIEPIINNVHMAETDNKKEAYYLDKEKNISKAILTGTPRIDYFNFNKNNMEKGTIINIDEIMNLKTYNIKDLPYDILNAKTYSGHRTIVMPKNKVDNIKSKYILGKRII